MFAESRPEVIEDMRQAADELRASSPATPSRSSSIATSTSPTSASSAARSAASASASAPRTPTSTTARSSSGACTTPSRSGRPRSACSPASTPTGSSRTTSAGCASPRRSRRSCTCTRTARWRSRTCATSSGLAPEAVLAQLHEAGLDSVPGTAAEVLDDGVRQRISPNKLPVARWVEIIEAAHRVGLRSTVTVMFGHIETPAELAEHMRVVRGLQERTGGFTEFVPLSFIPFHTQLGRTARDRRDQPRGEPQAHRGVPARARPDDHQPAGELGEDGARRRHRGAALGRQRPRRHADGGVDLAHGGLLPRRQARPRRPDRAAHRAGRPAAERTTLYGIRRRHELAAAA